jgi:hypothetical protein
VEAAPAKAGVMPAVVDTHILIRAVIKFVTLRSFLACLDKEVSGADVDEASSSAS